MTVIQNTLKNIVNRIQNGKLPKLPPISTNSERQDRAEHYANLVNPWKVPNEKLTPMKEVKKNNPTRPIEPEKNERE